MVTSSPEEYVDTIMSVLRNVVTSETVGVYISVNKPYFALTEEMEAQKIPTQNMYFLDCASGLMGKSPQEIEKTYILSGPTNLTELSITLSTLLSSDKLKGREAQTILFLDSISTFLIYNDANVVARFLHTTAGRVRTHHMRGVFFSLHDDITKGAIAGTVQFHDKVLRFG
jgi:archaellum biogenesis ATPase FlaH